MTSDHWSICYAGLAVCVIACRPEPGGRARPDTETNVSTPVVREAAAALPSGPPPVGEPAPLWGARVWVQGGPLSLEELRGRPVLLRWWTDTCPYCEASAPVLKDLHLRYRDRGLVVVGVYHPKPPRGASPEDVRRAAERLGIGFPVMLDNDWSLLRRYWLDRHENGWTSVSFLIDRRGIIRHVHPGGEYHAGGGTGHEACEASRRRLEEAVATVLRD